MGRPELFENRYAPDPNRIGFRTIEGGWVDPTAPNVHERALFEQGMTHRVRGGDGTRVLVERSRATRALTDALNEGGSR
jgi:hypothetical protein